MALQNSYDITEEKILSKPLLESNTRPVIKNFLFLLFVQIAYYAFPLISMPYLVRVLGPEKYGLVAFAQSFIGYFILITNYGFDLSATREISVYREQKEKLAEIFSSVIFAKLLLSLLCFVALVFLLQLSKFRKDSILYILTFGIIMGQCLFPLWLFLGLEKMKYITIFIVIERAIFTLCVFIFVKNAVDYIYVPLLNTIGYMISGLLSISITLFHFKIAIKIPNLKNILYQLRQGWNSFIATTCMSLYSISNIFILGLFSNNTIVGYYAAAEKLIYAAQRILVPLSQAVYPYISKTAHEEKNQALNFIRKIFYINVAIGILLALIIFPGANILTMIVLGPMYRESIHIMQIFAFLPLASAIINVLGFQTMIPFKMDKELARILLTAGLINIVLALILIPLFEHLGAANSLIFTMLYACLMLFWTLKKRNIHVF